MEILGLGHSAYLLSMRPKGGSDPVRILVDPWLSDFALGDLMGRFPRVRFDPADLPEIHGLFLSHAHTDHLDPESLLRLWSGFEKPPALILPVSLLYLETLLTEYLPGAEVVVLSSDRTIDFRGLALTGFFNPEPTPSNEDDVMLVLAENGSEVFLGEADALLPMTDPETRVALTEALCGEKVKTICWVTSRNELSATMSMVAATDLEDRAERVDAALTRTAEEIEALYAPLETGWKDLWHDRRLVRLISGQGIAYPQEVRPKWNRVLFPVRIEDRVRLEAEIAEALGCRHRVEVLAPGQAHLVEKGKVSRTPIEWLELLDSEEDRHFDPTLPLVDDFPTAPLRSDIRDQDAQTSLILDLLNDRFLPHLTGMRRPPVEQILADHGGEYRIRIRFGNADEFAETDFVLSFGEFRFVPTPAAEDAAEIYWANDLEDFYAGRADEFSLFPRKPIPAPAQRLWLCLGMPYLNNDLVRRKFELHFTRAARGGTNREWALGAYDAP
jgi:hypothetical protein